MYAKILKNYSYFIFKYFLTILVGFVVTPLILKFVGTTEYGVYTLILEYLGYLVISDLGLSMSSHSLLNKAWAKNDQTLTIETLKFLAREYLKTIPVVLIVIIAIYLSLFHFTLGENNRSDYLIAFSLMAITGFMTPLNIFKAYLISSERSFLISQMTIIQLFTLSMLNLYFSYKGVGIVGLAISFFVSIVIFHIILTWVALKKIKEMPVKGLEQDFSQKELWHFNKHSLIQTLMGKLCYATDTIILSFFSPPAMITSFVLNQKLARLSDNIIISIGNSSWATLTEFSDNPQAKQKFIDLINKIFILLAYPMLMSMAINNQDFINLWVGEDIYISQTFTLVSFANYLIFGVFSFWGWIFVSEQRIPSITRTIVVAGTLNVFISFFGAKWLGPIGPVLGTFVSFYSAYLFMIRKALKLYFSISVDQFIKQFTVVTILMALLYPFLQQIKIFNANNWLGLLLNLAITYIPSLCVIFLVVTKKSEWNSIWRLLRRKKAV
jgi:O-antigen/teichoic acid export membrane protein